LRESSCPPSYGVHFLAVNRPPPLIFVGGLIGAIFGAKLGYIICELPFHFGKPDFWWDLFIGRTILGGLLGGYIGVELAKRAIGYTQPTGDSFAVCVPLGLAIGRIGCHLAGCCQGLPCRSAWYCVLDSTGQPRYPSALMEAAFNAVMFVLMIALLRAGRLRGQLFHIYLMAYALFRIVLESIRDTPRLGPVSSYQILAAILFLFALVRFARRAREHAPPLV
jgi:phosphatidylglycerol:prolipoprotein diacylglycerol transferase